MDLNKSLLEQALETLGNVLSARGQRFELVTVGGSSLILLGLLSRSTKDLDIVALVEHKQYIPADPLPDDLLGARDDVAVSLGLDPEWLNPGPTELLEHGLPEGFESRTVTKSFGGLIIHLAGRFDQICFKLYAAVDQGPRSKHVQDLKQLQPTHDEFLEAANWTLTHDSSEGFRRMLIQTLEYFGIEDIDDFS